MHSSLRVLPFFLPPLTDIVLGDADLMRVFTPLMRHVDEIDKPLFKADSAFSDKDEVAATMRDLVSLVSTTKQPFGVIIDEAQKITEAAERDNLTYFKEGWYGWQYSPGNAFVRMDIASSHGACVQPATASALYTTGGGTPTRTPFRIVHASCNSLRRLLAPHAPPEFTVAQVLLVRLFVIAPFARSSPPCSSPMDLLFAGLREFTLVSGEHHRLRFVRPWARGTAMDFLSDKESPGYLKDPATRKRVHYICGGVLRSLFDAKRAVDFYGTTPAALDAVEAGMRSAMKRSCDKWMKEASPDILQKCTSSIANLVRGSTPWEDLKPAYDQGLVALAPTVRLAVPVSSVAASVLHAALAMQLRKDFTPLDQVDAGLRRGDALEAQLHAVLDPCDTKRPIPTYSLDGRARSLAVTLRADYALPFLTATETTPAATKAVLYPPKSGTYPCDAIIVPATNDPGAPVILLESSVTPPTDDHRLEKLLAWFRSAPQHKTAAQADSAEAKPAPRSLVASSTWSRLLIRRVVSSLCCAGSVGARRASTAARVAPALTAARATRTVQPLASRRAAAVAALPRRTSPRSSGGQTVQPLASRQAAAVAALPRPTSPRSSDWQMSLRRRQSSSACWTRLGWRCWAFGRGDRSELPSGGRTRLPRQFQDPCPGIDWQSWKHVLAASDSCRTVGRCCRY